jgi:hypothetical protein
MADHVCYLRVNYNVTSYHLSVALEINKKLGLQLSTVNHDPRLLTLLLKMVIYEQKKEKEKSKNSILV